MINRTSVFNGLLVGFASSLYVYRHHSFIDSILFAVSISFAPLIIFVLIAVFLDDDLIEIVFPFISSLPFGVLISSILTYYLYVKNLFH